MGWCLDKPTVVIDGITLPTLVYYTTGMANFKNLTLISVRQSDAEVYRTS